eukprot:2911956-Lingulodinium_polyedra.AAC.1
MLGSRSWADAVLDARRLPRMFFLPDARIATLSLQCSVNGGCLMREILELIFDAALLPQLPAAK